MKSSRASRLSRSQAFCRQRQRRNSSSWIMEGSRFSTAFELNAGIGDAKSIVAVYLSEAAAELQAAAAAGKAELNTAVIHLRAEIAGLKAAMATSPFPYGGDASQLPEGTVLAGAYEFRIDAADTNHPYTLPRILIGLIAMIAGGFAARALAGRRTMAERPPGTTPTR